MPLESATYINTLVSTNPPDTDSLGMGAAHVRLIKAAVQATFPNLTGAVSAAQADLNLITGLAAGGASFTWAINLANMGTLANTGDMTLTGNFTQVGNMSVAGTLALSGTGAGLTINGVDPTVPVGGIIMYAGAISDLPSNWKLCDGTNGTPNLTDRFIMGAGNSFAAGVVGGVPTVTLSTANMPSHTHTATDSGHNHALTDLGHTHIVHDPAHSHAILLNSNGGGPSGTGEITSIAGAPTTGGTTQSASTGITINASTSAISAVAATANISVSYTGGGAAFSIVPPFYALAFIQRIT